MKHGDDIVVDLNIKSINDNPIDYLDELENDRYEQNIDKYNQIIRRQLKLEKKFKPIIKKLVSYYETNFNQNKKLLKGYKLQIEKANNNSILDTEKYFSIWDIFSKIIKDIKFLDKEDKDELDEIKTLIYINFKKLIKEEFIDFVDFNEFNEFENILSTENFLEYFTNINSEIQYKILKKISKVYLLNDQIFNLLNDLYNKIIEINKQYENLNSNIEKLFK